MQLEFRVRRGKRWNTARVLFTGLVGTHTDTFFVHLGTELNQLARLLDTVGVRLETPNLPESPYLDDVPTLGGYWLTPQEGGLAFKWPLGFRLHGDVSESRITEAIHSELPSAVIVFA